MRLFNKRCCMNYMYYWMNPKVTWEPTALFSITALTQTAHTSLHSTSLTTAILSKHPWKMIYESITSTQPYNITVCSTQKNLQLSFLFNPYEIWASSKELFSRSLNSWTLEIETSLPAIHSSGDFGTHKTSNSIGDIPSPLPWRCYTQNLRRKVFHSSVPGDMNNNIKSNFPPFGSRSLTHRHFAANGWKTFSTLPHSVSSIFSRTQTWTYYFHPTIAVGKPM